MDVAAELHYQSSMCHTDQTLQKAYGAMPLYIRLRLYAFIPASLWTPQVLARSMLCNDRPLPTRDVSVKLTLHMLL